MKKFLSFWAIVMIALPLSAQLKQTSKVKVTTLATIRMGVITVAQSEKGISMSLTTNNRFDNPGFFFLGETKESALASIDDLIQLLDESTEGEAITVESSPGEQCQLIPQKQLGLKTIYFKFDGCAGMQNMSKAEFEKVREAIAKKAL